MSRSRREGVPEPPSPLPYRLAWIAGASVSFWALGFNSLKGSDVWWHLAAGRSILATGSLPRTDTWSFTAAGRPWLNHEWLAQLLYGLWMREGGMQSLVWLEWILVIATLALLWHALHRLTADPLAAWGAAFAAGAVASYFFEIRPHMYSLAGFAAVLVLTVGRERPSWWLPAVFAAWANLHAGVFFGIMTLGVLLGGDVLRRRDRFLRHLALGLACLAGTLATPDGVRAWLYTLRYAGGPDPFVARLPEWQPAFDPAALYAPLFPWAIGLFVLSAAVVLADGEFRRSRWGFSLLALGLFTLAMAVRACRFIPLFALAASPIVALALAEGLARVRAGVARRGSRPGLHAARFAMPAGAALLGALLLARYPLGGAAFPHLTLLESFPVDSCDFIEANSLTGNVFNYYGWGGYVILRTGGRLKVFIDGRFNVVYENATFERYLRVLDGAPDWNDILERSDATYILWPTSGSLPMLQRLVDSGRWKLIHQDFVSVLLCRADRIPQQPLRDPPDSPWRQLALAGQARSEGRLDEAEQRLGRALQLQPDLRPASLTLASIRLDRGDRAGAIRILEKQQRAYPSYEVRDGLRHLRQGLRMNGEPAG